MGLVMLETASAVDFSAIDTTMLVPTYVAAIGAVAGVVVLMIAVKKAYGKAFSMLRKA